MLELRITVDIDAAFTAAVNRLADSLASSGKKKAAAKTVTAPEVPEEKVENPTPTQAAPVLGAPSTAMPATNPAPVTPIANSAPALNPVNPQVSVAPPAPVTPTVPTATPSNPVPVSAPQYTLDMIANAGTSLIDAGKAEEVLALLQKYGVDSLVHLDPKFYGAIALDLRGLGARI